MTEKLNRFKIIEKTTKLFIKKGYNNTSMNDIAKACHIKKASIYHHIPSRKVLVVEVITSIVFSFQMNQLNLAYDERYCLSKRLWMLLKAIEAFFVHSKGYCLISVLILEAASEIPEIIPLAKEYFTTWMLAIAHLLNERYGHEQSKVLAQDAVSQLQGAIVLAGLFQDYTILKTAVQKVATLLPSD